MAWSMPPSGQWGPGMGVPPNLGMGAYTAEQWAMQQQNWQQWSQWHQQYASWHSQFGTKYSDQYHAMQMGGIPPLPPTSIAPPPAPPPPEQQQPPPPPPPHENNQPLYGHAQPVLAAAPSQNTAPPSNSTDATGNNQPKGYPPESGSENSVNSEALRTLAEEQKAFDIQFQQWEEEFDKWKKANISHPDKKAYQEYEQTFEACKARLLERRLQMKQKRARLLSSVPQAATPAAPRQSSPPLAPPSAHNISSGNYLNNKSTVYPPQNFNNNQNNQYSKMPPPYYREKHSNSNYEPQDRQESYSNKNKNDVIVSSNLVSTEPFLPPTKAPKGIPGLDLVPETDRFASKPPDVIDITDEPMEKQFRSDQQQPDYSTISKGINNILGDEKIMNILSMMRGQAPPIHNPSINPPSNTQGNYNAINSGNNRPNYMGQDDAYNDNYETGENVPQMNQYNDYDMLDENRQANKFVAQKPRPYNDRPEGISQNQYNDRNQHSNHQARMAGPGMQQNMRPMQAQNDYARGGFDARDMHGEIPPQPSQPLRQNVPVRLPPPMKPKWTAEPLFTPSIIVEYDHKPLRLKARDFIEPVHTFDYNHKSKDGETKRRDFEKEADDLFTRIPRGYDREDRYSFDRYGKDLYYRNIDRDPNREMRDFREERGHGHIRREEFEDRRRFEEEGKERRHDERRRDERDRLYRRDDALRDRAREDTIREQMFRDRERDLERIRARERDVERNRERAEFSRDRDTYREKNRDFRRSRSRDIENRKRAPSREEEASGTSSKKVKATPENGKPKHVVTIDDLLETPGRQMRPEKIVIILRGPPGSGKSYLAKLIRDREAEQGGTVRVMSIDDYFMQEGEIEEKDPTTGKIVKKPSLQYEYDEKLEESYTASLKRAFKRSLTDGYFSFLVYDAVNDQLRSYADIWNFSRQAGFQVYICTMDLDPQACHKRNIHGRSLEDIEVICSRFFPTPDHHIQLDPTTLLQTAAIPDVHMEDADHDVTADRPEDLEVDCSFTSKWEKMDDAEQLARLDGTSRPPRPAPSLSDYLQLDDWAPAAQRPGKKTVRWADIEEKREQEKMRAIGFVVGQTDWTRMTDPTRGSAALATTKYIERVRRH